MAMDTMAVELPDLGRVQPPAEETPEEKLTPTLKVRCSFAVRSRSQIIVFRNRSRGHHHRVGGNVLPGTECELSVRA
ncbi:hypothetical protein EVAR_23139_1 [Eumeta japonica]|uniref:Uncharacterized protein n=1 Tax=Eumeta variegata TaxID=151549 RepID=A0A4C1VBI5_EUMVA|nr:hypothetical protein EVAR_23139_1 [Eumeta japonica]